MKFEDLKPGMLTNAGLIVSADPPGTTKIFGESKSIRFFDGHDAYYGKCSRFVKDGEEFEILHEIGSKGYKKFVQKCISDVVDCISAAQDNLDLLRAYKMLEKSDEKEDSV